MKTHELLKELRRSKGYYQKQVATFLNITCGTLSYYEAGEYQPSLELLVQFADFYGVTTDYLLGRTNCQTNAQTGSTLLSDKDSIDPFQNE